MNKALLTMSALALVATAGAAGAAGEAAEGRKLAEKVCAACHGVDGNSASQDFPNLAGQYESYIIQALHEYKSGARKNAVMGPQAANLSDQDIENAAAYFSQQKGKLHILKY